jgi:hypothetical protein
LAITCGLNRIEGGAKVKLPNQIALAALAAAASVPAAAQDVPKTVSAADPDTIMRALQFAGHRVALITDSYGDPQIDTQFSGWDGSILFYGCHEQTHQNCDSVQLRVGFDRAEPMTLELMHAELGNDRFYSVHLDDEGDPWFNWDIVTGSGEGISTPVFLQAVNQFASQVGAAASVVFAEEWDKDINFSAPEQREPETI